MFSNLGVQFLCLEYYYPSTENIEQVYPVWCSRFHNRTLFIKKLCKKLGVRPNFWEVRTPSRPPSDCAHDVNYQLLVSTQSNISQTLLFYDEQNMEIPITVVGTICSSMLISHENVYKFTSLQDLQVHITSSHYTANNKFLKQYYTFKHLLQCRHKCSKIESYDFEFYSVIIIRLIFKYVTQLGEK